MKANWEKTAEEINTYKSLLAQAFNEVKMTKSNDRIKKSPK
jgi:hypothetical protein